MRSSVVRMPINKMRSIVVETHFKSRRRRENTEDSVIKRKQTTMNHKDHVNLLQKGVPGQGGIWADLGSGTGAFTLALADLIGPTGQIYSIEKDQQALKEQEKAMRASFPATTVHYITADFTHQLDLPPLDGIVMANSLHFIRHKDPVLQLIRSYLRPGGRLILVEYNADRGNMWVPYPLSYGTWETLSRQNGFTLTQLLTTIPSRFFGEIYSAVSLQAQT
jgi:ubiquinone/menaquinone biosynthesis C-methylase UbiE